MDFSLAVDQSRTSVDNAAHPAWLWLVRSVTRTWDGITRIIQDWLLSFSVSKMEQWDSHFFKRKYKPPCSSLSCLITDSNRLELSPPALGPRRCYLGERRSSEVLSVATSGAAPSE